MFSPDAFILEAGGAALEGFVLGPVPEVQHVLGGEHQHAVYWVKGQ